MGNSRKKIGIIILGIIILSIVNLSLFIDRTQSIDPFFTLVFKTNGGGVRPDYGNFLKQHCARIGINIDVIVQDWPTFVGELIAFRDFDICYVSLTGGGADPDFTGVYDENGSLNLFGYHTSMDWDVDKGTGLNEWYMRQGKLITPPNSEERIQHYWAWQQYLMDKILPLAPTYSPREYTAYWSTLADYNFSIDIIDSWGKMNWIQPHEGQESTDEFVIADAAWSDLNPMFQDDVSSSFISNAILDPLIYFDAELRDWPHLAESYNMINDTWMRITARQNVPWGDDPDGLFLSEEFDIYDVYFTFYAWKHVSNDQHLWSWIKDMQIIDQWTMDLFIDGNPLTSENDPFAPFLPNLNLKILPEHYLNQTQIEDGVTPDITHSSWNTYATNCFGTGLFEISRFTEGVETVLTVKPDCWRLDPVITADPALDWANRFGFGVGWDGMHQLRIRIIPDIQTQALEFEAGYLDLMDITWNPDKRDAYEADPDYTVQDDIAYSFGFFGFNMREVRPIIGNRAPAPGDVTLSIGLCVRKAIAYALDRFEINNVIHRGEYAISDTPLYPKMGIWNNPNIIRYNFDIDKALDYMTKAGYDIGWEPEYDYFPGIGFIIVIIMFYASIYGILPILFIVSFIKSIKHIRNLKKNNFWPFRKSRTVRIISITEQGYSWKYEVGQ
ncbi:MAG: ABC transporter substrate-binding protein [Candidatus Heimdallarchaeota archaeon]